MRPRKMLQSDEHLAKNKFLYLTFTLVLLIFISPYLTQTPIGEWLLVCFSTLVLITLVFATVEERHHLVLACCVAFLIVTLHLMAVYQHTTTLFVMYQSALMVFYIFTIVELYHVIIRSSVVDRNIVFAALSIYLLLGVAYANAYSLIYAFQPGAFAFTHQLLQDQLINHNDLIYYSFTTLTTVGYGDIVPTTYHARSVVILEEITGVLYLAVLVARLVAGMKESSSD